MSYNENIIDILIDKIIEKKSPFCVGLDSNPEFIPNFLIEEEKKELEDSINENNENNLLIKLFSFNNVLIGNSIYKFNKNIIDKIKNYIPAVKIQVAYYELIGPYGLYIFKKTIDYAKSSNLIVISDIKRNDIDATAKAYSNGYLLNNLIAKNKYKLENFNSDFITINPYLGKDGILPFLENSYKNNKGIFILAKTSNPSSSQIQDKYIDNIPLFFHIIKLIRDIELDFLNNLQINNSTYENQTLKLSSKYGFLRSGIVAGATFPKTLLEIREKFDDIFILIPGIGKQGGKISDIKGLFKDKFIGGIINVSRSVIFSYIEKNKDEKDFANLAKEEIENLINEFNI